jgi:hypothetical protein
MLILSCGKTRLERTDASADAASFAAPATTIGSEHEAQSELCPFDEPKVGAGCSGLDGLRCTYEMVCADDCWMTLAGRSEYRPASSETVRAVCRDGRWAVAVQPPR